MFKYFWEELGYVYSNEETFESLFRLLARREQSEMVGFFLKSRATKTFFLSMSYAYRTEFLDHVLQIKGDILKELNQQVIEEQNKESSSNGSPIAKKGIKKQGKLNDSSFSDSQRIQPKKQIKNKVVDSDNSMNNASSDDLRERMNAISNSDFEDENSKNMNESKSSFDPQEFLFEKKQSLDHFFITVYE